MADTEAGSVYGDHKQVEIDTVATPVAVGGANVGVMDNRVNESKEAVYNEYLRIKADLEKDFPDAAKMLPMAGMDMDAASLQKARDEAASLKSAEEGKAGQKAMMEATVKIAGGVAVAAAVANNDEPKNTKDPETVAKNHQFAKLLDSLGIDKNDFTRASDARNVQEGDLSYLKNDNGLPNLVAAIEQAKSPVGASRERSMSA